MIPCASQYRRLHKGDELEVQHEGGWWKVAYVRKQAGNVRLGQPPTFVVEAVGYGITRSVGLESLRPLPISPATLQ